MKLPFGCEEDEMGRILCDIEGKPVKMKYCEWSLGGNSSCTGKDGKDYGFPDSIFPIRLTEKSGEKTTSNLTFPAEKRTIISTKDLYTVGKIGDLGEPGDKSVILNLLNKKIVRRILVEIGSVLIDICTDEPALHLPKDLDVYYEPWFMDRGSFLFKNPPGNDYAEGELLKLATEFDLMRVGEE